MENPLSLDPYEVKRELWRLHGKLSPNQPDLDRSDRWLACGVLKEAVALLEELHNYYVEKESEEDVHGQVLGPPW